MLRYLEQISGDMGRGRACVNKHGSGPAHQCMVVVWCVRRDVFRGVCVCVYVCMIGVLTYRRRCFSSDSLSAGSTVNASVYKVIRVTRSLCREVCKYITKRERERERNQVLK